MIPVVLITGFLGAGKTTLLNHLLKSARGTRIGVIVNDFGAIDVDAMSVAGRVDSMISLGNGCLCCAADTSDIDEMLAKLADPALRMDVIVIESSGLADPQAMVRKLLASAIDNVRYGGLVTVVDAVEFPRTAADHPDLARQLKIADLIVLNKTDRVTTNSAALTATATAHAATTSLAATGTAGLTDLAASNVAASNAAATDAAGLTDAAATDAAGLTDAAATDAAGLTDAAATDVAGLTDAAATDAAGLTDAAATDVAATRATVHADSAGLADLAAANVTATGAAGLADLTAAIRAFNGDAPLVPTVHAAVDPALLFETAPDLPVARQLSFEDLEDHHDHAHAVYDTVAFTSDAPMNPVPLMDFLDNRPAGLYRMKGFVHFDVAGHTDRFTLQTVGNYLRFHRSPWPRGTRPKTELVLIGRDVDTADVHSRLAACVADTDVDPGDMLWVTRYVSEHPA